ncbi:ABC transporter substrate-binding protein [Rhodoplanes sp. Z2-YC6860]|uniref:ABC transporter substrate-binding protein n=1 Tax=Rhodoplanes sp. Z2-YC6860 TaxID=674703 RepID=UPI00078B1837|nr:ABC transporter substrate-binding protein [Rhodoplanes sp. Z2-YC6860]AMN44043.1 oligopeptide ABC transporter substrate-binding protein [Rhodoplanes sp. Z2-YC6860]
MSVSTLKRLSIFGAAALAFLALDAPAPAADRDSTLIVSQGSDVLTLDPMLDTSPISLNVFRNIFDALTRIAADGSVAPQLAESWTTSEDTKTWDFKIRSGALFHNGQPVTAEDVVWSYQRLANETKSPVRTYINKVKSVEAVGSDTVRFTLSEPFAPFDRQVSLISILPKQAFEQIGAAKFALEPVGSGPFKVVRWVKDDHVELAAFDKYWGGAPKIKTLVFKPVPSAPTRAAALSSGELDVVPILPPALVDVLGSRKGLRVEKVSSNKVVYLGFDVNNPALSDVRIRQAIDLAIDRNALTSRLLRGLGKPSGQIVAPVTFGYSPDIKPTGFDQARAKQLVAESGYKGEKLILQYPNNNLAFGDEVAQAIANYLGQVGIKVELQGMEYSAFFPLWANRKLNSLHLFAYGPSIMDADQIIGSLYDKTGRVYWLDPKVQDLAQQQRGERDKDKRKALIAEILKLSRANVPYAPLYDEMHAYGISDRVKWQPRPDERLLFQDAEIVKK